MDWTTLKPIKVVNKVWGTEYWLANTSLYCCKILNVKKGFKCSLHHHRVKDETFILLNGNVKLERNGVFVNLEVGDRVHIPPYSRHCFTGLEDSQVLEISTHHSDDDVVRDSPSCSMEETLNADPK